MISHDITNDLNAVAAALRELIGELDDEGASYARQALASVRRAVEAVEAIDA